MGRENLLQLVLKTEAPPPSAQPPQLPETVPPEKPYERRFSFFQRLFKVLFSPSEGMKDIALTPSFSEVFIIILFEIIVTVVAGMSLIFMKIKFAGSLPPGFWRFFWGIMAFAIAIAGIGVFGFMVVRWLIKSLIVKAACDRGSGWDFKTAASVTGYAYLADVVTGLLGLAVLWFLMPSIVIDVTNLEAARQAIAAFQSQIGWTRFLYSLPIYFLGIVWKSYLGSLGIKFGTKEKCSMAFGFAVFLFLSLIGIAISLIVSYFYQPLPT